MKYNFKSVALFATAILTIGAFSACSNEIENIDEPQKETKTITFTATLGEDDPLSRTSHQEETADNGIKLKVGWESGDVLYIGLAKTNTGTSYITLNNDASGYKTATISNIRNNGKTADFTLKNVDTDWETFISENGGYVNIIYGKAANVRIMVNKNDVQTMLYNHDYKNEDAGYLKDYDFMHARAVYNPTTGLSNFSLTHYTSFIKYKLYDIPTNETITYFKVSTNNVDWKYFARNVDVKNDGKLESSTYYDFLYHKQDGVNITADGNNIFNIYYSMAPTDLIADQSVTITAITANGTYTGVLEGMPKIEAGKVYVTTPIKMTKQQ